MVNLFTLGSTKTDFVRGVMSAAASADGTLSPNTRMLLAAWAAHESGWGKTKQAKQGFNLWNYSRGNWQGRVLAGGDTEYVEGVTNPKTITQWWRQYGSLEESIKDVLSLLRNGYVNYKEGYGDLVAGAETFATRLGVFERGANRAIVRVDTRPNTAGFYTMPRSEYQAGVSKLYREVAGLAQGAAVAGLLKGTQS